MRFLVLLFTLLISGYVFSQNISGTWIGNYEKAVFAANPDKLVVEIFIYNDSLVTGASHLYYTNNTYEHYKIKGYYNKSTSIIHFSEDSTIAVKLEPHIDNCLGNYTMKLNKAGNTLRLEGRWKDNSTAIFHCASCDVWLEKQAEPTVLQDADPEDNLPENIPDKKSQRSTDIQSLIEIGDKEIDSIKIDIYDNGIVDNDTVSVYFNNDIVISQKMISQKPISFYVRPAKEKLNKLILIAENLGSIPPCTAFMIVTTKKKRYEVNLSSDTHSNAAIEFFFRNEMTQKK